MEANELIEQARKEERKKIRNKTIKVIAVIVVLIGLVYIGFLAGNNDCLKDGNLIKDQRIPVFVNISNGAGKMFRASLYIEEEIK